MRFQIAYRLKLALLLAFSSTFHCVRKRSQIPVGKGPLTVGSVSNGCKHPVATNTWQDCSKMVVGNPNEPIPLQEIASLLQYTDFSATSIELKNGTTYPVYSDAEKGFVRISIVVCLFLEWRAGSKYIALMLGDPDGFHLYKDIYPSARGRHYVLENETAPYKASIDFFEAKVYFESRFWPERQYPLYSVFCFCNALWGVECIYQTGVRVSSRKLTDLAMDGLMCRSGNEELLEFRFEAGGWAVRARDCDETSVEIDVQIWHYIEIGFGMGALYILICRGSNILLQYIRPLQDLV